MQRRCQGCSYTELVTLLRVLVLAVVWLSFALSVLGQASRDRYDARYDALKQALGLSDAQLSQLQQMPPPAMARPAPSGNQALVAIYPMPGDRRPSGGFFGGMTNLPARNEASLRVLDDSQKSKLAVIQKTLDRWDAAAVAIGLGFIDEKEWPGGSACLFYPVAMYFSYAYALELGLTPAQEEQFKEIQQAASEPFWAQVREKVTQRSELLNAGVSADSPAVVQLNAETDKLQAETNSRPRRDLALAVLDEAQRAKLAAFVTALEVANEAIEIGLIPKPLVGEPLCH
jgi:hypothetical protein